MNSTYRVTVTGTSTIGVPIVKQASLEITVQAGQCVYEAISKAELELMTKVKIDFCLQHQRWDLAVYTTEAVLIAVQTSNTAQSGGGFGIGDWPEDE